MNRPPSLCVRAKRGLLTIGAWAAARSPSFFDRLGDAWPLTAAQRDRILPAVKVALDIGWAPRKLAAFTGSNTGGLRNPYAVLTARLSPAELPMPQGQRSRPPWCGECDERTRMLGFDGDAPRPCPNCKPVAVCRATQILSIPSSRSLTLAAHPPDPVRAGNAARARHRRVSRMVPSSLAGPAVHRVAAGCRAGVGPRARRVAGGLLGKV
jgi:hypothetical protein